MTSLERLEDAARRQLALFEYPTRDWMLPAVGDRYDVVVLGAGPRACSVALGLRRERIRRIVLIDTGEADATVMHAAIDSDEGWRRADFAGYEVSLGPFSFRAWLAAVEAAAPDSQSVAWQDYGVWLRALLAVPVLPAASVGEISVGVGSLVRTGDGSVLQARRLVVATSDADRSTQRALPLGWDDPGLILGFPYLSPSEQARIVAAVRPQPERAPALGAEWCWHNPHGSAPLTSLQAGPAFVSSTERAISLFGTAAVPAIGPAAMGANLIRFGLPLLLNAISRSFFLEDQDALFAAYNRYDGLGPA